MITNKLLLLKVFTKSDSGKSDLNLSKANQIILLKLLYESLSDLSLSRIVMNMASLAPVNYQPILRRMERNIADGNLAFEAIKGVYPNEIYEVIKIAEQSGDDEKLKFAIKYSIEILESKTSNILSMFGVCRLPFAYYLLAAAISSTMSQNMFATGIVDLNSPIVGWYYHVYKQFPLIHSITVTALLTSIAGSVIFFGIVCRNLIGKRRRKLRNNIFFKFYDEYCSMKFWRLFATVSKFNVGIFEKFTIINGTFSSNKYMKRDILNIITRINDGLSPSDAMSNCFITKSSLRLYSSIESSSNTGEAGANFAASFSKLYVESVISSIAIALASALWILLGFTLAITLFCTILISTLLST